MSAKCDFCGKLDPEWMYPAVEFAVQDLGWGSSGGWAACESCSTMIEDDNSDGLVRRALDHSAEVKAFRQAMGGFRPDEWREVVRRTRGVHDDFRRSRRGPRRPFG